MGKIDKQMIRIPDGKYRYRVSVQNILKTEYSGVTHTVRMEIGVEWSGAGRGWWWLSEGLYVGYNASGKYQ